MEHFTCVAALLVCVGQLKDIVELLRKVQHSTLQNIWNILKHCTFEEILQWIIGSIDFLLSIIILVIGAMNFLIDSNYQCEKILLHFFNQDVIIWVESIKISFNYVSLSYVYFLGKDLKWFKSN